jgi:hypothetical protein
LHLPYAKVGDRRPLTTLDAFRFAALSHSQAARVWLMQLSGISSDWIVSLLAKVPDDRMSAMAKEFATQILIFNKDRLLALQGELP